MTLVYEYVYTHEYVEVMCTYCNGLIIMPWFLVQVVLNATGDTPIIKKKNWRLDREKKMEYISSFVKHVLKCDRSESLASFALLITKL